LGAINNGLTINNLPLDTQQPDGEIINILKAYGAIIEQKDKKTTISSNKLQGKTVDFTNNPDLLPICCVLAACSESPSTFINIKRLEYKGLRKIACKVCNNKGIQITV
jgi:3-phosphoshikimate 1-carboxyvinyltransferase